MTKIYITWCILVVYKLSKKRPSGIFLSSFRLTLFWNINEILWQIVSSKKKKKFGFIYETQRSRQRFVSSNKLTEPSPLLVWRGKQAEGSTFFFFFAKKDKNTRRPWNDKRRDKRDDPSSCVHSKIIILFFKTWKGRG